MKTTRRLFIGLAPPARVAEDLHAAALGTFAPHEAERLRFTAARDLHLTLLFLGEVEEHALSPLVTSLERATSRSALDLEIAGTGAFPSRARPRILWAGASDARADGTELDALRHEIVCLVREAGITFSARETEGPYRPHMTIARVRSALKESAASAFFELGFRAAWRADEVVLFHSAPPPNAGTGRSGGGAAERYVRLQRFRLGGRV